MRRGCLRFLNRISNHWVRGLYAGESKNRFQSKVRELLGHCALAGKPGVSVTTIAGDGHQRALEILRMWLVDYHGCVLLMHWLKLSVWEMLTTCWKSYRGHRLRGKSWERL
jgi:hypothetical protein